MVRKAVIPECEQWLRKVGMSKSAAARHLHISEAYFSRILKGSVVPSADLFAEIEELVRKLKFSGLAAG